MIDLPPAQGNPHIAAGLADENGEWGDDNGFEAPFCESFSFFYSRPVNCNPSVEVPAPK